MYLAHVFVVVSILINADTTHGYLFSLFGDDVPTPASKSGCMTLIEDDLNHPRRLQAVNLFCRNSQ